MICRNLLILLILPIFSALTCRENGDFVREGEMYVGFYNLDNLYDTLDDTAINDEDFTPFGKHQWNSKKYQCKLNNLSKVIKQMAQGYLPDVLGVCEIENGKVLTDLMNACDPGANYKLVHYDSEDERGIDVGLIYNTSKFKLMNSKDYVLRFSLDSADRTRSQLWVKLLSIKSDDTMQFIVCHFPSRREGKLKSEQNRVDAALLCKHIISENCRTLNQNLILLGDFNDEPWDKSIQQVLGAVDIEKHPDADILNLMYPFKSQGKGSYRYKDQWNILDQIMISHALSDHKNAEYVRHSVEIFSKEWMMQKGKFSGYPLRTFGGDQWLNGYSDHLPVFIKIRLSHYGKE